MEHFRRLNGAVWFFHTSWRGAKLVTVGIGGKCMLTRYLLALGAACAFVLISHVGATAAAVPDFSGVWARPYVGFEPPVSGPGPVLNRSRVNGQSNLNAFVGDYTNPILKPNAAEAIKRHAEIEIAGATAPNPSNQCRPMPPPYILQRQQMQF